MPGTTIQPALTPEEWALCSPPELFWVDDSLIAVDSRAKEPTEIRARSIDVSTRPHAIAAVALHGQPFGFTHEDVDLLRSISFSARRHQGNPFDARVHSLADRLAALLPPE